MLNTIIHAIEDHCSFSVPEELSSHHSPHPHYAPSFLESSVRMIGTLIESITSLVLGIFVFLLSLPLCSCQHNLRRLGWALIKNANVNAMLSFVFLSMLFSRVIN